MRCGRQFPPSFTALPPKGLRALAAAERRPGPVRKQVDGVRRRMSSKPKWSKIRRIKREAEKFGRRTFKTKEKLMNDKMTRRHQDAGVPASREEGFWSPFHQLSRLRNEIDRFFGSPLEEFLSPTTTSLFEGWAPSVDLYEDKDKFVVRAELPGMKKEDIEVTASGDTITISGEKK